MKVDLHGMNHNEAIEKVEEIMLVNSAKGSVDLTVVTGNAPSLQAKIITRLGPPTPEQCGICNKIVVQEVGS